MFQNALKTFFEKYIPKLTWEWLSIVVFEPEPTFFMGGNNFYFFTPKYLGFISKRQIFIFSPESTSVFNFKYIVS